MKRFFAYLLSFLVMYQPLMLRAQIVVDNSAGSRPLLDTAPNGVPIVNITAPSGAGVSVNQFTDFNVGTEGIVINNGATTGNSQLAGAVYQNPLFQGGAAATTILNWTTGTNRSQLNGFTEIFGQRANYIMANPNGITCNGCGFINTPRVSLTTGNPLLSNGRVTGFDVMNGDVAITGEGLNASEIDYFEIISRTAAITGQVNAQDFKVVAGQNHYDYETQEVTAQSDGSAKPAVAIDASALGSIYAGRIAMVSTEDGVGVRADNEMVANAGDIEINANGDIIYKSVSVTGNTNINTTGNVTQTERASAGGNIEITGANIEIQENAAVAQTDGNIYADGILTLTATSDIINDGEVYSGSDTTITSNTLTNNGGISSLGALIINSGTIDNNATSLLFSRNDMTITTDHLMNAHANIYSHQNMNITARTGAADGEIYNFAGWIKANGNMTLDSDILRNIGENSGDYDVYWHRIAPVGTTQMGWVFTQEQRAISRITSIPSIIESGYDMLLQNQTMLNYSSDIVATHDLTIESTLVQNQRAFDEAILKREWVIKYKDGGNTKHRAVYPEYDAKIYSNTLAKIIAGNLLTISDTATIEEDESSHLQGVFYTDSPTLDLSDSLIVMNTDSSFGIIPIDGRIYQVVEGQDYLIETRNLYEDGGEHMRSQYFLDRMGMDASTQDRLFLGDEYYESQLIAQQVRDDRGELFVAGSNAGDQREQLWENTIAISGDLELALGVELTIEQVARLTDPIVWYVEEEVNLGNGHTEIALVPRVYYPTEGTDTTKIVGGILRGNDVMIASHRDVNSKGAIIADNTADITAQNINGQGLRLEGETVNLTTTENLNLNALIGSSEATMQYRRPTSTGLSDKVETIKIGTREELVNKGEINATNLNINAGNDANISGTNVAIAQNAEITAGNDVAIGSNQVHNEISIGARGSDSYLYEKSIENVGSDVAIGNNLTVSGNSINIIGSQIDVAETANLDATEDINIMASRDLDHKEMAASSESAVSSMSHKEVHTSIAHNKTGLSAKNLTTNSGNDTNIIGGDVSADEILTATAGGNINTAGVKDSEYHMVYHSESSFDAVGAIATMAGAALTGPVGMIGGAELALDAEKGSADTSTTYDETVQNSSLSGGSQLSLSATQDATFIRTDLDSNAFTTVNAGGDILVGTMSEEHMSEHQHTEWGGDIVGSYVGGAVAGLTTVAKVNTLGLADLEQFEDMAEKAGRAEKLDYSLTNTVLQKKSNIATENLETVSGNNTSILGSNVIVNNNADMQTGGDLIIGGVQETSSKTERHEDLSFDNVSFSNTNSSASVHVEQKKVKSEQASSSSTNKESVIQVGGNLNANSDKGITVIGSTVAADGDVNLTAVDDVQILAGENTYSTSDSYSKISNTITGTVGNEIVGAVDMAYQTIENFDDWEDTSSSHINNTARVLQATLDTYQAYKLIAQAANTASSAKTLGFYAAASLTQAETKSTEFSESTQAVDSMIFGNNINIETTADATIKGSTLISENDININADNIIIESAQSTYEDGSAYSSRSLTEGVSTSGISIPTWSETTATSSSQSTTEHHALLNAGGALNTTSINDTTVTGANLTGADVNMEVGGDLAVETRRNVQTAHSEHESITVGQNNMGFSVGESNQNTAWVNNQTSIIGTNSVAINSDTTDVKGAVIANKTNDGTDGGNLTITTNQLTVSDVAGHDYQDSASVSVGTTGGAQEQIQGNAAGSGNGTIRLGYGDSEISKEQIAYGTIGQGNVSGLTDDVNRDINQTTKITKDERHDIDVDLRLDGGMLGVDVNDINGKLWAAPNTAIGLTIGTAGYLYSHTLGDGKAYITLGNNAIEFNHNPLGAGGISLGNTISYFGNKNKDSTFLSYEEREKYEQGLSFDRNDRVHAGSHEGNHTWQAQDMGPLYIPLYFLNGGPSANNWMESDSDHVGRENLRERGLYNGTK